MIWSVGTRWAGQGYDLIHWAAQVYNKREGHGVWPPKTHYTRPPPHKWPTPLPNSLLYCRGLFFPLAGGLHFNWVQEGGGGWGGKRHFCGSLQSKWRTWGLKRPVVPHSIPAGRQNHCHAWPPFWVIHAFFAYTRLFYLHMYQVHRYSYHFSNTVVFVRH